VEKGQHFWRTRASGGLAWISRHLLARDWGIVESEGSAHYMRHEAGNSLMPPASMRFLRPVPSNRFFHQQDAVRFDMPLTFPGYHAEARRRRRAASMVTRSVPTAANRAHLRNLGSPLPRTHRVRPDAGLRKEIIHFVRATKSLASALYVARRLSKHAIDVMRHGRGMNSQWQRGWPAFAKSAFELKDSAVAVSRCAN